MPDSNPKQHLDYLCEQYVSNRLTEAEAEKLRSLMEADHNIAKMLFVHLDMNALLDEILPIEQSVGVLPNLPCSNRRRRTVYRLLFALTSSVVAVLLALLFLPHLSLPVKNGVNEEKTQTASGELSETLAAPAQIVRLSGIQWENFNDRRFEWDRLEIGQSLKFLSGSMEIMFAQGVHVILEGPAAMRFIDPLCIDVPYGRVVARVGKEGTGFTINTPKGKIVDRGTEFGVDIKSEEGVQVVVFSGKVDVFPGTFKESKKLSLRQGEGLSIGKTGTISPVRMIESGLFLTAARQRFEIPSKVIVSVGDNIRDTNSPKFYEIVHGGFREDALAYVDRIHEWNGVDENGLPKCLIGGDYIRSFNNDRYIRDYKMNVELAVPATLYVLLDRRNTPPDWLLNDFVKTDLVVGIDEGMTERPSDEFLIRNYALHTPEERGAFMNNNPRASCEVGPGRSIDNTFDVWKRVVLNPGIVILGAQPELDDCNQYGVVAVALTPATAQ